MPSNKKFWRYFFNSAVGVLQTLVVALGAGLGIWGVINLMEGYGNDNPGANAHVRSVIHIPTNADYYGIPLIPYIFFYKKASDDMKKS